MRRRTLIALSSRRGRPAGVACAAALVVLTLAGLCVSADETRPAATSGPATTQAAPVDVLLVADGDALPYRQAAGAAERRLTASGRNVGTTTTEALANDPAVVRRNDVVFVGIGTGAAAWLQKHLRPGSAMVYCLVADPKHIGLHQGPPRIGVATDVPIPDQFRLIAQALPSARKVAVLYRSKTPDSRLRAEDIRRLAPRGWTLDAVDVDSHNVTAAAIRAMLSHRPDVVLTTPDKSVYDAPTVRALLLSAMCDGVPVFGFSGSFVRAGALVGVGIDPEAQGRQAAEIVNRVLAEHRTFPSQGGTVEAWMRPDPVYEIAVNLVVAERLSIELDESLVAGTSQVYGAKEGDKE
jgi:ABC-type uncharacterized transport system substrate-binding protein